MPPLATNEIWLEPLPDLLLRWHGRQTPERQKAVGDPMAALTKVRLRADRLQAYCRLPQVPALHTSREWDTRWDATSAWGQMNQAAWSLGCRVERVRGAVADADIARAMQSYDERPAIVIADGPVEQLVNIARTTGLNLRFGEPDAAVLVLAAAVYDAAASRMGHPALDWVEELANPMFVQKSLGLPFSPLVFRLLAPASH